MEDFTLPRRDLEIKLCKCGLLAEILIRAVLFKPVFLQDQAILLKSAADLYCLSALLCRFYIHERFHPPPQRFGDKIVQFGLLAVILTHTVLINPVFLQDHAILLKSAETQL